MNLASKLSCLVLTSSHVWVWPSSWSSWSCSPCRVATVPVVLALLAWWRFTNRPVWCRLAVSFVIVSCSPGGVVATVREQAAALGSLAAFLARDAADLDLGCQVEPPGGLVDLVKSRPGSCDPSRSGWGRTPALSGCLWTVQCHTGRHRPVVLSCLYRDDACPVISRPERWLAG